MMHLVPRAAEAEMPHQSIPSRPIRPIGRACRGSPINSSSPRVVQRRGLADNESEMMTSGRMMHLKTASRYSFGPWEPAARRSPLPRVSYKHLS